MFAQRRQACEAPPAPRESRQYKTRCGPRAEPPPLTVSFNVVASVEQHARQRPAGRHR